MTSTIGFKGTGFMKCMPITRSGRRVRAPTRVIEKHEVLTAKIVRSGTDGVDPGIDLLLDLPLLGNVLDDEVGVPQGFEIGGEGEASEDGCRILLLRSLLEHPLEAQVLPDLLAGAFEDLLRDVHQHRLVSGLGEVLPHPHAHHSGADDADFPDLHARAPEPAPEGPNRLRRQPTSRCPRRQKRDIPARTAPLARSLLT